jgi:hypothetical protein
MLRHIQFYFRNNVLCYVLFAFHRKFPINTIIEPLNFCFLNVNNEILIFFLPISFELGCTAVLYIVGGSHLKNGIFSLIKLSGSD